MASWLLHPALLIGGLIAILSPIIIHLLNKRRFKRIDWGAMDFLLQAQKLNRRRIKLEELILLLMRCLAMVLIGLLLARPFLASKSGEGLFKTTRYERVIILDDSLSMKARAADMPAIEAGRKTITDWISGLASAQSGDSITLLTTSQPNRPLYKSAPLSEGSAAEILDDVRKLKASDGSGDLAGTLLAVEQAMGVEEESVNRIVYVLTDLRLRDWAGAGEEGGEALEILKRISERAAGCYIMDLAGDGEDNLLIEDIVPQDKALIAGVASGFDVTVRNYGTAPVTDVKVLFSAGETIPIEGRIERIEAGDTGSTSFSYTFALPVNEGDAPEPVALRAEIDTGGGDVSDLLADDNTRFFPARVSDGIRVLIVDGDPSGNWGQSESFYLRRALAPRGEARSGIVISVVDDQEFEQTDLGGYQVVIVANLYRVTATKRDALDAWTREGGGLVLAMGDQVDEDAWNEEMWRGGKGLLPVSLRTIDGDDTEESWTSLVPQDLNHPVLQIFEGESNPLLRSVKIFQWWDVELSGAGAPDGAVTGAPGAEAGIAEAESGPQVLAVLGNEAKSPALIEKAHGDGRVFVSAIPFDADWSNWPDDGASFVITMQELTRYVARSRTREGELAVGQTLRQTVDLTVARPEAELLLPDGKAIAVQALPGEGKRTEYLLEFEDTQRRGFYRLNLKRPDGGEAMPVLFAANINPQEGDLTRLADNRLKSELGDAAVTLAKFGQPLLNLGAVETRSEFWKLILYVLAALLCAELFYGWWLGHKR